MPNLRDLLLHRYGSIPDLEAEEFFELIAEAKEQKRREEFYAAWVALLPVMQLGYAKFVSFEEYFKEKTGGSIDTRPKEEILAEVHEFEKKIRGE